MAHVLVTRPEPGASATAAALRAMGHEVLVSPLLEVRALPWMPPVEPVDSVILTSANAARCAGPAAAPFHHLPAYAVGAATADAARGAGFTEVRAGSARVGDLLRVAQAEGRASALYLAGRDRTASPDAPFALAIREVYAAELADLTAEARAALAAGAVDWALLFSTRTAARFAKLCPARERVAVAAISEATLAAAGPGWAGAVFASQPTEAAIFAAAGLTCDKAR